MKALCAALVFLAGWTASAANFSVSVESGAAAMSNVVVRVAVPDEFPDRGMLSGAKEFLPFQKASDGTVIFVLPQLGAHSSKRFTVSTPPSGTSKEFASADLDDGRVTITTGGKKVFVYQGAESALPRPDIKPQFKRGGYIHPVFSRSGKQITDDYPPNHIHHHGIWFPWTKTSFEGRDPDFWNMGQEKGKVEFVKFGGNWSGSVHAGLRAEHRFIDLTSGAPKPVLNETWLLTAYHLPGANYSVFDLVSTQTCATSSPLILPKYYYGGLGIRGNWAWNGAENCSFLTSNGETDRVKGNETRGNWVHMGGTVEGEFTGMAVLSHPDNFRSPQPMRLHPKEPFFCFAPSQVDDWKIEPGTPYISKYRFIVSDGRPDKTVLDQLWESYAHPPKVVIEKL